MTNTVLHLRTFHRIAKSISCVPIFQKRDMERIHPSIFTCLASSKLTSPAFAVVSRSANCSLRHSRIDIFSKVIPLDSFWQGQGMWKVVGAHIHAGYGPLQLMAASSAFLRKLKIAGDISSVSGAMQQLAHPLSQCVHATDGCVSAGAMQQLAHPLSQYVRATDGCVSAGAMQQLAHSRSQYVHAIDGCVCAGAMQQLSWCNFECGFLVYLLNITNQHIIIQP